MNDFMFKYRGWLFVPAALIMLALGRPSLNSMIIGFIIAFVFGEGIRIWAVGYSGVTTRDDSLRAPRLITAGPYGHLRNPLYLGNLISWLGFCVAATGGSPWWARIVIFASTIISYVVIYGNVIPLEENFLEKTFGESFIEYKKSVPRLIPCIKPYDKPEGTFEPKVITSAEIHTIIMLVVISIVIYLKYIQVIPSL